MYITVRVAKAPLPAAGSTTTSTWTVPITLKEALLGGPIEVPTLQGSVRIGVPPGAQSGQRLRVRGKGFPARRREDTGDLHVVLQGKLPEPPSDEAGKAAVEQLEALYSEDVRAELRL